MNPERWNEIRRIAEEALQRPAGERVGFLDAACGADRPLREEVARILAGDANGDELAGIVMGALASTVRDSAHDVAGTGGRIGAFRLLERIGAGGMGTVYAAEQDEPRRIVALKTLNGGFLAPEAVRRFRYESEILARLNHPAIAQVYEAGTQEVKSGDATWSIPYFAMELVPGARTLIEYAEAERLDLDARLSLFLSACDAVHHGHQKGIIHRDLKPGNVLVGTDGRLKVIDFGVARVADAEADGTGGLLTRTGQLIGTLRYMSPEQVQGRLDAIDTRSDVYALGVVLYELLSGSAPHDLAGASITESIRRISVNPPRRLRDVRPSIPLDLDWIAGRAVEREKERRYGSAGEFAADVRRFLRREPILARPPSISYQLRRFAARHKALVLAASLLFVGILSATAVTLGALQDEVAARRDEARQRRAAEAVVSFLNEEIIKQADPWQQPDPDVSLRQVIESAAARIDGRFEGDPFVEASIRRTIGRSLINLGLASAAREQFERAATLFEGAAGPAAEPTLDAKRMLGHALRSLAEFDRAEALYAELLPTLRRTLGEHHPMTVRASVDFGGVFSQSGRPDRAREIWQTCLDAVAGREAGEPEGIIALHHNLGDVLMSLSRYDEAEPHLRAAVDMQTRLHGERYPPVFLARNNLARFLSRTKRLPEALELYRETLERQRAVLSDHHPETLITLNSLGAVLIQLERYDEAEPIVLRVAELRDELLGPDHPRTLSSKNNVGMLYLRTDKYDEAEPFLVAAFEARAARLGPDAHDTVVSRRNLADLRVAQLRLEEAERLYVENVAAAERGPDRGTVQVGLNQRSLGDCLVLSGRIEDARQAFAAAYATFIAVEGEESPRARSAAKQLATTCSTLGLVDDAAKWSVAAGETASEAAGGE